MALAPLLYNITFDSQTRILYFWDKAGHEIYHCEIPSPAPALPTVEVIGGLGVSNLDVVEINSGASRALRKWNENVPIPYNFKYIYSSISYSAGSGALRSSGIFDFIDIMNGSSFILGVKNISSSAQEFFSIRAVYCDSPDATVITVYDSSNNPYNAFKYTSDGTDYYYVLDGTQTDWTDDLASIGYHILSVAYLGIQDTFVNWKTWVWLFENNSASRSVSFDSNKSYIFDSAYTLNGNKVNLTSHTITIGRPNSTTENLGLIDSYSGFTAYKIYYHTIPNS